MFYAKSCSPKTELSSSTKSQINTDGMQIIRQSLSKYRISPEMANFIYNVYINQCVQFCSERACDPMHPTVESPL